MISDEQIKEIWHNTPTQGDPSGHKFSIAFARAILALAAAPTPATASVQAPAQLPESMSRDEVLKYYSEYANVQSNEALRYQKRIRELEAALPAAAPAPVSEPIRVKFDDNFLVEWSDSIPDGEYILALAGAPAPDSQGAPKQHFCEKPVAKKLIGWRTADYLWETTDPAKAKNWEANVGILPIFEGDPNTKISAPSDGAQATAPSQEDAS